MSASREIGQLTPVAILTTNALVEIEQAGASFSATVQQIVDLAVVGAFLPLSGGTMSGDIAMATNKITGVGDPTALQDVATKNYVDTQGYITDVTGSSLIDGRFWIGDAGNLAVEVIISGDITISNTGVAAISPAVILDADINASAAINLTKIAITGTPDGTKFLRDDATWQTIPGGGDALTSNPLSQFAATTSAQLAGVITDETGTGVLVFGTSPVLVTPDLGTPTALVLTNATGLVNAGVAAGAAIATSKLADAANFVLINQANVFGDFNQDFKDNRIRIFNPADTFSYTITAGAITANRALNLPVITGTDTLVTTQLAQTLVNKTLTLPTISSINNAGTLTLPTGTHTLATLASIQTLTNKTIAFGSNTLTNVMSLTTAQAVTAGIKKTFSQSATLAGFSLGNVSGDPSAPVEGDLWYNSSGDNVKLRKASSTAILADTENSITLLNKTLGAGTVFSVIPTINDGIKFTFNPDATVAGINVGAHTADPSAPVDGDIVYNSTTNALRARINAAWVSLGAGGGGLNNIVEDTTPQLGGTLDANGNTIDMGGNNFILNGDSLITENAADDHIIQIGGENAIRMQEIGTEINTVFGAANVLATNATDGFMYLPSGAGPPTGTPTSYTGKVALYYDVTNNDLYIYNGAWRGVELA